MKGATVLAVVAFAVTAATALAGGPGPGGGQCCTRIEGQITSIDPILLQIVVNNTVVQVTPNTVIKMRGQTITFADLQVGMTVVVCGKMNNNVLEAKQITVKGQCPNPRPRGR